jgi:hypothetical protein
MSPVHNIISYFFEIQFNIIYSTVSTKYYLFRQINSLEVFVEDAMTNYRKILPLFCFLCSRGGFLAALWTHYHTEFFVSCHSLYLDTCICLAPAAFRISRLENLTFFLTDFSTTNIALIFNNRVWILSRLNWIGRVYRMDSERKVCEEYNNNPQGSGLRGRPKNRRWNCVQQILTNANYKLEREVKNRADWEKSIKEAKIHIGL